MDSVTHGLTGALMGYCGFRQRGGQAALWTCIAASEFPDIDAVLLAAGNETYLQWHRSFTHSIVLLPVWAALVAWTMWELVGRTNFKILWAAAAAGIGSHIVLDWLTNYGTMWLWPVSDARFALNWVFILDPYVWAMLGVTLWAVLRLKSQRAAPVGLGIVCGYFLLCGLGHAYAGHVARARAGSNRVAVFAQPLNPLRWTVVHAGSNAVYWSSGGDMKEFPQFRDEVLLPQAEATEAVKLFRWFAVMPVVEKLEQNGRTVLRYRDLRFLTPLPWSNGSEGLFVVAKVVFDERGTVRAAAVTGEGE